MTTSEQAIGIAAKMYDARSTLKRLCPDKFYDRCKEWQEVILKVSVGKGISELEAVIDMLQTLKESSGMSVLWVLAAYVEMVEPSGVQS